MAAELIVLLALLTDAVLGEPKRFHPLVGFGKLAARVERWANLGGSSSRRRKGLLGWMLLVLPMPLLLVWLTPQLSEGAAFFVAVICLYFSIGWRSLREHGLAVSAAYRARGLAAAREQVGRIVSRDTDSMDEPAVACATIESVLENGSDAIFAPLFWFLVFGPAGAVGYRLANTLDAMWGYRTERFNHFGWASAKMDDLLNWLPARLTAITYALLGNRRQGLACWRHQAEQCASPNGGPVMCSGAGALNITLGGGAFYHGSWQSRPEMGMGQEAQIADIGRAVTLIDHTLIVWCVAVVFGGIVGIV